MCALRLKTKFQNIYIINAHAPTEDKSEEMKDEFYHMLEDAYNSAPENDVKLIMGDFNAKIGKEQIYMDTIGKHSLHEQTSENGERLIDFATSKNMIISSTCYIHPDIHKQTWVSPDGQTINQIDHILIDRRHGTNILDVRSKRGAHCGSDHYLVRVKYRARIKCQKQGKGKRQDKINIQKLKDETTLNKYKEEINKKTE